MDLLIEYIFFHNKLMSFKYKIISIINHIFIFYSSVWEGVN